MRLPPRKKKPSLPGSAFTPPPRQEVTPRHQIKGEQILGILKGKGVRFDSLLIPPHVWGWFLPQAEAVYSDKYNRLKTPEGYDILVSDMVPNWECAAYLLGELVAYVELEDYR